VDADIATGRALGVRGTPTFLINGVLVIGAVPIEQFRDAIDEALRRAASSPKP
jgi:protein-disulfide isomerase